MFSSIPKIKVGKNNSDYSGFDLSHDVNTTADFGFVQPLMCQEMIPDSKLKVALESFCRFAPMVTPTFGRVAYKTYHRFVPCSDLMHNFENLIAQKPYYSSVTSYVPDTVPYFYISDITKIVLSDSPFDIYTKDSSGHWNKITTGFDSYISAFNSTFKFSNGSDCIISSSNNIQNNEVWRSAQMESTPEGADFIISNGNSSGNWMFCFNLSQRAKNIRKVLLGLGYQLSIDDLVKVSALPVFAYYKCYFDLFVPQQVITWDSTNAHYMLDYCVQHNSFDLISTFGITSSSKWLIFVLSLGECWYTQGQDYVSAHIATPAIGFGNNNQIYVSDPANLSLDTINTYNNSSFQPFGSGLSGSTTLSKNFLDAINRLTKYVNKQTQIGGKIAEYLGLLGATYTQDTISNHIGSNVMDCRISDVMSNTENYSEVTNTGAKLGEYAGKGIGYDKGSDFTYHANTFGYWITLATVVPNAGYCQALNPNLKHLGQFDFFNGMFDALGYQITTRDSVLGSSEINLTGINSSSPSSFGFIPRYSEQKVPFNVLNGDLSIRSKRSSLLPYTLDRFISDKVVSATELADGVWDVDYSAHNIPMASTAWRYLNNSADNIALTNFNRIFYEEGNIDTGLDIYFPLEDKFIIHNIFNMKYSAPMKSISDSFDTDADKSAIDVMKA